MLAETTETNVATARKDFKCGLQRICDPQKRITSNPPDIMDRWDEFGSGHYVITATLNGGQLRRTEFDLISSPILSEKR
ncbi:MAG: hypothetical protein AABX07_00505 [Nanoarchaeota archaeon]